MSKTSSGDTKFIWRIERVDNGYIGPYSDPGVCPIGMISKITENYVNKGILEKAVDYMQHPSPYREGFTGDIFEYRCGFSSLKKARTWFYDEPTYAIFEDLGYHLVARKRKRFHAVKNFNMQCLFKNIEFETECYSFSVSDLSLSDEELMKQMKENKEWYKTIPRFKD